MRDEILSYALPPSHLSHKSASTHGVRFGVGSLNLSEKLSIFTVERKDLKRFAGT